MSMKPRLIAMALTALLLTPALAAQSVQDEIAFTRAQIEADRQVIVAATLGLSEEQGNVFWPLYREYRAEMDAVADRNWTLMIDFAEKYESLTDADANEFIKEWMSIQKKELSIRDKWVKKISKAIGGATTARFVQIENKLNAIINLEASAGVPLATPAK